MGKINKLISSEIVIGDLIANYGITNINMESRLYDMIAMGMQIMEIDGYFVRKVKKLQIKGGSAPLPCDAKYLGVVLGSTNMNDIDVQSITYNDSIKIETISKKSNLSNVYRIPIRKSHIIGLESKGIFVPHSYNKGYINNNRLYVNFDEGEVLVIYFGLPTDCNGYPMIVDDPLVRQALPFYVIWRLVLGGYRHPSISMEQAHHLWIQYYPQARNRVNYPDMEELQSFTEMNTNPLLGNLINFYFDY